MGMNEYDKGFLYISAKQSKQVPKMNTNNYGTCE